MAFGEDSSKWIQPATASTRIKKLCWKIQPSLHRSALQNCTCRQQYVKKPQIWKQRKVKTSYGFPPIAFLRLLLHILSKCIKNNCTETLRTGNKTCCSVQTILEAGFDSHNSHWKILISAWIKIICFGSNKRFRSELRCSSGILIRACFQIFQDVQESSESLVTLPALILTLYRALGKKKKKKAF